MNLTKVIEVGNTKNQCMKVVAWVGNNKVRFKELVDVFLRGPYRITQRAAWPLTVCVEKHPGLATPYFPTFISMTTRTDQHDAVRRNILRLFQFVSIPKRHHGKLLDICFDFLKSPKEPVAVKVFSMAVIHNIIKLNRSPELAKELAIILEDQLPMTSAGYRSRASKILRGLDREFKTMV